jgi:hypothetical protein
MACVILLGGLNIMKIVAFILAIILFALVPIFAHWQFSIICLIEIIIIGTLIASNYIYVRRGNSLPKSKGKHQIPQGGA